MNRNSKNIEFNRSNPNRLINILKNNPAGKLEYIKCKNNHVFVDMYEWDIDYLKYVHQGDKVHIFISEVLDRDRLVDDLLCTFCKQAYNLSKNKINIHMPNPLEIYTDVFLRRLASIDNSEIDTMINFIRSDKPMVFNFIEGYIKNSSNVFDFRTYFISTDVQFMIRVVNNKYSCLLVSNYRKHLAVLSDKPRSFNSKFNKYFVQL